MAQFYPYSIVFIYVIKVKCLKYNNKLFIAVDYKDILIEFQYDF